MVFGKSIRSIVYFVYSLISQPIDSYELEMLISYNSVSFQLKKFHGCASSFTLMHIILRPLFSCLAEPRLDSASDRCMFIAALARDRSRIKPPAGRILLVYWRISYFPTKYPGRKMLLILFSRNNWKQAGRRRRNFQQ